eukprot:4923593-Amphidinium_carterae.3
MHLTWPTTWNRCTISGTLPSKSLARPSSTHTTLALNKSELAADMLCGKLIALMGPKEACYHPTYLLFRRVFGLGLLADKVCADVLGYLKQHVAIMPLLDALSSLHT